MIYICTESGFPSVRLDQMVTSAKRPELRDLILVQRVRNVHHLLSVLSSDVETVFDNNDDVSLVVIDSVAAVIRYDHELGGGIEKGGLIHKIGRYLLDLAFKHRVAVIAVNQVWF